MPVNTSEIIRDAVAGLVGTVAMSGVMAASQKLGVRFNPPPRTITSRAARAFGIRPDPNESAFTAAWVAGHFAYGAAAGALFGAVRRTNGQSSPLTGAAYGLVVWAVSYLGWLPAVGLYPWPSQSPWWRRTTMIVAHVVYGAATAQASHLIATRDDALVRY